MTKVQKAIYLSETLHEILEAISEASGQSVNGLIYGYIYKGLIHDGYIEPKHVNLIERGE